MSGDKTSVSVAGDVILIEPLPSDYDFSAVKAHLSRADFRLFNLECVLSDAPEFASTFCGGTWLATKTAILDEILKFGFNACGWANNHTMDYSYNGLLSTRKALNERNLPNCGAGLNLQEASQPVIVAANSRKIGLISICSSFDDAARAGDPSTTVPGRPGLNPLRFETICQVSADHLRVLQEIARVTQIDGQRDLLRLGGFLPQPPKGALAFGEHFFAENPAEGKMTAVKPEDMTRTQAGIAEALQTCGPVIVLAHSHEIKRDTHAEPDYFFEEFCRKCIDAGASAVIGTGTHQLKAIEIYKGRPLFYSIGNFIFQTDRLAMMPADFNEKYHLPDDLSPQELIAQCTRNSSAGLHSDTSNFLSIAPYMEFAEGRLVKLELLPLALDRQSKLPAVANREETAQIFQRLSERSAPCGTQFKLGDGLISVVIEP